MGLFNAEEVALAEGDGVAEKASPEGGVGGLKRVYIQHRAGRRHLGGPVLFLGTGDVGKAAKVGFDGWLEFAQQREQSSADAIAEKAGVGV